MKIIDLFVRHPQFPKWSILFFSTVFAISSVLLIAVFNGAARKAQVESIVLEDFFIFLILEAILFYSMRIAYLKTVKSSEQVLYEVRMRIIHKVQNAKYRFIEEKGKITIYRDLTQNINMISQNILSLRNVIESAMILFCLSIYVFIMSLEAFLTVIAVVIPLVYVYLHFQKFSESELELANEGESELFDRLSHLLDGFKEMKLNHQKSEDFTKQLDQLALRVSDLKYSSNKHITSTISINLITIDSVVGAVVFILPLVAHTTSSTVMPLVATMLFAAWPLMEMTKALPELTRINAAAEQIIALEEDLDTIGKDYTEKASTLFSPLAPFQHIVLQKVIFHYKSSEQKEILFSIGPVDLTLRSGELSFIVGGNGSGKSTLMKLLTGLYYPDSGSILIDDRVIQGTDYTDYRELFSTVFVDFHLFNNLYGLNEGVDDDKVNALIRLMQLSHKTRCVNGRFSHTDLSTGQRKRLAFISSLLDDKPVYVFDELVADQDPEFRAYFYEKILPDLKQQGKTVIAVTHDDRYFHLADRVFRVSDGGVTDISPLFNISSP